MIREEDVRFLEHYGVKGMKWGVRRTPEQLGRKAARSERKEARKAARRTPAGRARTVNRVAAVAALGAIAAPYIAAKLGERKIRFAPAREIKGKPSYITGSDWIKNDNIKRDIFMQNYRNVSNIRKATPMGPIGSTGISRLGGGIPMPRPGR